MDSKGNGLGRCRKVTLGINLKKAKQLNLSLFSHKNEYRSTDLHINLLIDEWARWEPWEEWEACSADCGIGTKRRTRKCSKQSTSNNDEECSIDGSSKDHYKNCEVPCNEKGN